MVDDEEDILRVMERRLQTRGFHVDSVLSGPEALIRVKTNKYDLILLDIAMPMMDGFETCCHLKADPKTKHMPIIMFTAMTDKKSVITAIKSGADDFCIKSVDIDDLLKKIDRVCGFNMRQKATTLVERLDKKLDRAQVDAIVRDYDNMFIHEDFIQLVARLEDMKDIDDDLLTTALSLSPMLLVRLFQLTNKELNKKRITINSVIDLIRHFGVRNSQTLMKNVMNQSHQNSSIPKHLDFKGFVTHSLACAHVARALAKEVSYPDPELVYFVALIHDIGKLILSDKFPQRYSEVVNLTHRDKTIIRQMEQDVLDVDHAFVGYRLCDIWELSKNIQFGVFHHHHLAIHLSNGQKEKNSLARLVSLADMICKASGMGASGDEVLEEVSSSFWEFVNLSHESVEHVAREARHRLNAHLATLGVEGMNLQVHEELNELCFSQQMIVYHHASDVVNLTAIGLSLRGVDVVQVDSLQKLSRALREHSTAPLIMFVKGDRHVTPLDHEEVRPFVARRQVVAVVSPNSNLHSHVEQTVFLKAPVSLKQIVESLLLS